MADYIDLGITIDPTTLQDEAIGTLQTDVVGWEPNPGNLETIMLEVISEMAAETALVASQVPTTIFRYFGQQIVGLQPIDGLPAMGTATFIAVDTDGHTIPAGTFLTDSTGSVVFQTVSDCVISPGSTSCTGTIQAINEGTAGNGYTGALDLVDTLTYIASVSLVGTTSGGLDPETDTAYLDRLVSEMQILAPRPIVPTDFEVLARRIAGVDRATAIDGYNPADSTYNNDRMIALAAIDSAGSDVSSAIKTQIDDLIQSRRELNFVFNVISPTYTTIDVTADVTVLPGWDAASVQANVASQIQLYLQPYNWGRQDHAITSWVNTTKVSRLNLANVIKMTPGVAFINTLTLRASGGTLGTSDVTLTGAAPLTNPGAITVTYS